MQAGARRYPEPRLPGQQLKKPGREADLKLAPMYEAPYYRGSGKLRYRTGGRGTICPRGVRLTN